MSTKIAGIVFVIAVFTVSAGSAEVFRMDKKDNEPPKKEHYQLYGEKTTVTTYNTWLSNDVNDLEWIVVIPGTPEEVYIIDQQAQEEISHMETIHHPAVTHQENVYSTRTRTAITYLEFDEFGTATTLTEVLYNATDAQIEEFGMYHEVTRVDEPTIEQYVSGTRTVIDQAAWDEEIKVIDQEKLEEIGHYETQIVGEVGYYVNKTEIKPGQGDGHFEARIETETIPYQNGEE